MRSSRHSMRSSGICMYQDDVVELVGRCARKDGRIILEVRTITVHRRPSTSAQQLRIRIQSVRHHPAAARTRHADVHAHQASLVFCSCRPRISCTDREHGLLQGHRGRELTRSPHYPTCREEVPARMYIQFRRREEAPGGGRADGRTAAQALHRLRGLLA